MSFFRDLFKRHEHCFHTIADPGGGRHTGNTRKCCTCAREEELVSGPTAGHGPYISDPDHKVWQEVEHWGW